MTLVQEYLSSHTLEELYDNHGVKARVSDERPYKVSLNYDQLEVRDDDPLSQQCRGLVLRTHDGRPVSQDGVVGETVVLARPFDRFFNLGQEAAADVDLASPDTVIAEKLDGTLAILYYDDLHEEWHVATRSVSEANLPIGSWATHTFRTLFEKAVLETKNMSFVDFVSSIIPTRTYIFELCTPMNQIVVRHQKYSITLIGCRETLTGKETFPWDVTEVGDVPVADRHLFSSTEEMLRVIAERDPFAHEGVVACDSSFNRVKIKSQQYVALSRLKDAVSSPRNVMSLILGGNLDDALPVMPEEIKEQSLKMKEGFRLLSKQYRRQYEETLSWVNNKHPHLAYGDREHRKEFACLAKKQVSLFDVAMRQYAGRCAGLTSYLEAAREKSPNNSLPASLLDPLINKSLEIMEKSE